jgi:hypothetical protein
MHDMIDVAISNAAAFAIELLLLLLVAQLLVVSILRLSSHLLRWTGASQKFGDDWRSRVHGTTRLLLILLALILVLGHAGLCFLRVRTLTVAANFVRGLGRDDLIALGLGALKVLGVAIGAYLVGRILNSIVGLVHRQLAQSPWLTSRREQLEPLLERLPQGGITLLIAGGLCYTLGLIFFGWKRLRYHHFIWHLFVLAGSVCHYFAVLHYVIPAPASAAL